MTYEGETPNLVSNSRSVSPGQVGGDDVCKWKWKCKRPLLGACCCYDARMHAPLQHQTPAITPAGWETPEPCSNLGDTPVSGSFALLT
jgi:hypothetical protein